MDTLRKRLSPVHGARFLRSCLHHFNIEHIKKTLLVYGRMIKFSHTVFALPFALSSMVLASQKVSITFGAFFWILVAMVGARTAAMGVNRIVDADIDTGNPRTAHA